MKDKARKAGELTESIVVCNTVSRRACSTFSSVFAVMLVAMALWPRAVAADAYSGLSDPNTSASAAQAGSLPPGAASPSYLLGPSSVAGAPHSPTTVTRPAGWPGQMPQYPDTGYPPAPWIAASRSNQAPTDVTAGESAPPETKVCEEARILGRVGPEVIMAGDVMASFVHARLAELDKPVPEKYREVLLQNWLPRAVMTKLMYLEAKRAIPEENYSKVEKEIREYFFRESIPQMMKDAKVGSQDELEQKLGRLGTSLAWQQQLFIERTLGYQWMGAEVKMHEPVNPEDMVAYYREHLSDYRHPARARWEELMVAKSPTEEAAWRRLAELGNQVKDGLPLAEAARRGSEGPTAAEGGARDWTTKGSLVAEQLDRALFELPVGQLSPIIESDQGFHIVRVVERQEEYWSPYTEVQDAIRKKIQEDRSEQRFQDYIARLKKSTPVWTVYDEAVAKKEPGGGSVAR